MIRAGYVFLPLVLLVASGCGGGPKQYPVTGKLTADGTPLPGVRVSFVSTDENPKMFTGTSAADGSYRLLNAAGEEGAEAGKYKVVLERIPDPEAATKAMMAMREGKKKASSQAADAAMATPSEKAIPKEYSAATTSPKDVEVAAGSNEINIEI